jgi:hypothetical protein
MQTVIFRREARLTEYLIVHPSIMLAPGDREGETLEQNMGARYPAGYHVYPRVCVELNSPGRRERCIDCEVGGVIRKQIFLGTQSL